MYGETQGTISKKPIFASPFWCCIIYGDIKVQNYLSCSLPFTISSLPPSFLLTHTPKQHHNIRGMRSINGSKEICNLCWTAILNVCCHICKPRKVGHQNLKGHINCNAWCIIEHIKDRLSALTLNLFSSFGWFKNLIFRAQHYASQAYSCALLSILGGDVFAQVSGNATQGKCHFNKFQGKEGGSYWSSFCRNRILLGWQCCIVNKQINKNENFNLKELQYFNIHMLPFIP